MIPEFYQNHLKSQLSLAELIFLKILLNLLQSIKKVNLERLANALPLPIKFESRRKRIQLKRKGLQKYIARVKEYGRNERRHSSFYIGLYGQTWLNFKEICMKLVTEVMKINRNKLKDYQRGLRAMKLIESIF